MPKSGSQIILCDVPIRFDTYTGCSHACSYCFVKREKNIADIGLGESPSVLLNFIKGKRDRTTNWCDWDIPLHWGGHERPFPTRRENTPSFVRVFEDIQRNAVPFHRKHQKQDDCRRTIPLLDWEM